MSAGKPHRFAIFDRAAGILRAKRAGAMGKSRRGAHRACAEFEPVCTRFFLSLSSISVTAPIKFYLSIKFYRKQQQSNNVFDLFTIYSSHHFASSGIVYLQRLRTGKPQRSGVFDRAAGILRAGIGLLGTRGYRREGVLCWFWCYVSCGDYQCKKLLVWNLKLT